MRMNDFHCDTVAKMFNLYKAGELGQTIQNNDAQVALENDLQRLDELHDRGVRLIALTWNYENYIGYTHSKPEYKNKGLKEFGFETVEKMEELGIIVDVSHLSEAGGVAGLNFYGNFISSDGKSTIDDIPEIAACEHIQMLPQAMEKVGFATAEIEAVCYRNAERFFENYW